MMLQIYNFLCNPTIFLSFHFRKAQFTSLTIIILAFHVFLISLKKADKRGIEKSCEIGWSGGNDGLFEVE